MSVQGLELTPEDEQHLHKLGREQELILRTHATLEDNSYTSIAQHLQLPVGTVKSRLSRARTHLTRLRSRSQLENAMLAVPDKQPA